MTLVRSVLCASAISLATSAALAGGYSNDPNAGSRGAGVADATAMNERPRMTVDQAFDRLDTNRDNMIGAQEAKTETALDRVFEAADRNNTNSLDRQEFAQAIAPTQHAGPLFSSYDVNRDGVISWQEAHLDADLARVFTSADADRNNALTQAEFTDAVSMARRG